VITHYRGTLIDGSEFDSSFKRSEPARFLVTQVIPGWVEALQLMKVGAKWQLFVPSNLAYGERNPGPEIGDRTFGYPLSPFLGKIAKDSALASEFGWT